MIVAAVSAAAAEPVYWSCHGTAGTQARDWTIRIDGGEARPIGASYDRILQSARPTQYIGSRITADNIGIFVRDGNDGEQFSISPQTGALDYQRSTDLDHSGTERVLEQASGICTTH